MNCDFLYLSLVTCHKIVYNRKKLRLYVVYHIMKKRGFILMETCEKYSPEYLRYLELLSKEYKTQAETFTEIINLQAIVNLPKGTEHFMSDLHGEYEAFYHILNNCSGVIREKVEMIFANSMTAEERSVGEKNAEPSDSPGQAAVVEIYAV